MKIKVNDKIPNTKIYRMMDGRLEKTFLYDLTSKKKLILVGVPGAFTPTCSTYQLPNFEKLYDDFLQLGIEEIYCMSVNDSFVMNAWAKTQNIKNVKVIPDGSGEFTRKMGMLVKKENLGFGMRSWRYAAYIENLVIKKLWIEEGFEDNSEFDNYEKSSPENLLKDIINIKKGDSSE